MASNEITMVDDTGIEIQEQIVTDSSPIKIDPQSAESELATTRELNRDAVVTQILETDSPPKKGSKRQKRRHRYQTQNLIREISPQPPKIDTLGVKDSDESRNHDKGPDPTSQSQNEEVQSAANNQQNVPPSLVSIVNGKRTVQCNICKRQMTESRLANHIRLLHVEKNAIENETDAKRKEFRCEYCGKSYAIKYTYEQHVRTHTEGRPKCPECGSTFASAFSLFRHRAKVHNLEHNYTTHNCDQCERSFFSASELILHKQRHSTKKDHICPECNKAFSVKGNLKIHMRTHAKEKLYRCDICESCFSHPYSLVSHRRIHTNEFPYTCSVCNKNYRSKHQLTSHLIVHTDKRPFKCDECSKTFRSRTAFKMHQDQHKGIKRFTCKFCDRKFQCHANKLKHERRHIGEKKHKCEHCDKAFIEKQELRNHRKVHEKSESTAITKTSQSKREPKKLHTTSEVDGP